MSLRQYLPALVVSLLGLGMTLVVTDQERHRVRELRRAEMASNADAVANALQKNLTTRELVPTVFGALFTPEQDIRRSDLATVAERVFANTPSLVAISWLPRTPPSQAGALLDAIRQSGIAIPYFRGPNDTRIEVETLDRDLFPIQLIEPVAGNEAAVGVDAAAFPLRARALAQARDTGKTIATAPLRLVQAPDVLATILYTPVYRHSEPVTVDARRASLKGVITTVFRYDRLISHALPGQAARFARIHILDADATAQERLMHTAVSPGAGGPVPGVEALLADDSLIRRTVTWGGRDWILLFQLPPDSLLQLDSQVALTFAIGGLLTLMAAGYLALQVHNTARLRREVDARRRAEEQKDLLMREVNHRVKNSLQIVGAMLGMQGRKAADEKVRQELDAAGARVRAIAQVHERLYRGASVTTVDIGAYLRTLCNELATSGPELAIRVDACPVELPTDTAVPLGLLVVELVTNAMKHADPPDGCWFVDVAFGAGDDGRLELAVRDYGHGMPVGFSLDRPSPGLGMTVIRGLVRQLHADLSVEDAGPGARWRVRLPGPGVPSA